jgi:hypothetical protein
MKMLLKANELRLEVWEVMDINWKRSKEEDYQKKFALIF